MTMPPRARKAAPLRVVAAGETSPKPAKPKTVTEAADKGTPRELLVAMRSRIATAVEDPNTPARDLAALTKRLTEVMKDIEAIDARDDQEAERAGPVADEAFDAQAI
ncbi:hypothetical protein [Micromonospora sp. NPDC049204]|uniref:hypothetical protein n=1 Tax=Micromonospora sp. NPDC049204 TaxID=3154351 RepID=UPI0033C9ED2D